MSDDVSVYVKRKSSDLPCIPGTFSRGAQSMKGRVAAFDFESFYDSASRYSLKNMDPYAYVHHEKFDPYMVSVVSDLGEAFVGRPEDFCWGSLSGALLPAHNASFDGMVLNRLIELGRVPDFDRTLVCTADLSAYLQRPRDLKGAAKSLLGVEISKQVRSDMDGKTLADAVSSGMGNALLDYAADDAWLCLAIWLQYGHMWPQVEREISEANREAGWNGVAIDRARVSEGLVTLKRTRDEAARNLPWTCPENEEDTRAAGSLPALANHARSLGLSVPSSFKKDCPEMVAWIAAHEKDHPFIRARLDHASVVPHIARLESMVELADPQDVVRFSVKYFGAHCLTGDHEVLTRDGWVALADWRGGEIMQWSPDKSMRFAPATANEFENTEDHMVRVSAPYVSAIMTQGHTVPCILPGVAKAFSTRKADQIGVTKARTRIPVSGVFGGTGAITAEQMRVLVAAQADGSFAKPYGELIFTLRKPRKIERLRGLLAAAGVPFKEQVFPSSPTQTRITVTKRDLPAWLCRERKVFGPWLLDSTAEARAAFAEEVFLWDGWQTENVTKNGVQYRICQFYSTVFANMEWVATMIHLCGKSTGVISKKPAKEKLAAAFTLNLREPDFTDVYPERGHVTHVAAEPRVFCPTTETGFFLMRHGGRISVTGNTGRASASGDDKSSSAKFNVLNIPKEPVFGVDLRGMLVPRKGHVFMIYDYGQIEARIVQWLAGNTKFLGLIREIGNIYEADAVMLGLWDRVKGKLKAADKKLYASSKERVLGLGFSMGAVKFLATCKKKNVDLGCDDWSPDTLDRRAKFIIRSQAEIDWKDPANSQAVGELLAADRTVRQWRAANQQVVALWAKLQSQLEEAAGEGERMFEFELPSGRSKCYFNPHIKIESRIQTDPETGAKSTKLERRLFASQVDGKPPVSLHGGVIAENVVQATARDVMYWGAMDTRRITRAGLASLDPKYLFGEAVKSLTGWAFLWNAYDEVIFEVPLSEADHAQKLIPELLCRGSSSSWTKGLPLEVEGGPAERYLK